MRKVFALVAAGAAASCSPGPVSRTDQHTPAGQIEASKTPIAEPLVPLGSAPPEGVVYDGAYQRRQLEAFLGEQTGYAVRVLNAAEISGSSRQEYCGNLGTPDGDGELRHFRVVLWSAAEPDVELSWKPLDCDLGRYLVKDAELVSPEDAERMFRASLSPPIDMDAPAAASGGGGQMYALIDRVSTYAVLVGRGVGCGVDVSGPVNRVGSWLDSVAPPGSEAQRTLLPMFMQQSQYHAGQQVSGQSPDGCDTVARAIRNHPWP